MVQLDFTSSSLKGLVLKTDRTPGNKNTVQLLVNGHLSVGQHLSNGWRRSLLLLQPSQLLHHHILTVLLPIDLWTNPRQHPSLVGIYQIITQIYQVLSIIAGGGPSRIRSSLCTYSKIHVQKPTTTTTITLPVSQRSHLCYRWLCSFAMLHHFLNSTR